VELLHPAVNEAVNAAAQRSEMIFFITVGLLFVCYFAK
jgi:hypothetical protein